LYNISLYISVAHCLTGVTASAQLLYLYCVILLLRVGTVVFWCNTAHY